MRMQTYATPAANQVQATAGLCMRVPLSWLASCLEQEMYALCCHPCKDKPQTILDPRGQPKKKSDSPCLPNSRWFRSTRLALASHRSSWAENRLSGSRIRLQPVIGGSGHMIALTWHRHASSLPSSPGADSASSSCLGPAVAAFFGLIHSLLVSAAILLAWL